MSASLWLSKIVINLLGTLYPGLKSSDFPARLGLKAQQMAWLLMAQAQKAPVGLQATASYVDGLAGSQAMAYHDKVDAPQARVRNKAARKCDEVGRGSGGLHGAPLGWVVTSDWKQSHTLLRDAKLCPDGCLWKVAKEIGWVGEQCACRAWESGEARGKAMLEESTQSAGECGKVWVRTARKLQEERKSAIVWRDCTAHQIQSQGHRPWEWLTKSKAEATSHFGPLRGSGLAWPLMCGLGWLLA
ncbi:hypothetical protein EDB86DRAFT_3248246 [Lactarius hatsudake]|nr:hypothetical protein EDB86DRAFT_3248246 [Lactarius hatsudake]